MYSYKINNSYTVYVNYNYLNDCIKACKKANKSCSQKTSVKSPQPQKHETLPENKTLNHKKFEPLPQNTMLKHKEFGVGKVKTTDKSGIMYVAFGDKTIRFLYPEAIRKGYLTKVC